MGGGGGGPSFFAAAMDLPPEVQALILAPLGVADQARAACVCREWLDIVRRKDRVGELDRELRHVLEIATTEDLDPYRYYADVIPSVVPNFEWCVSVTALPMISDEPRRWHRFIALQEHLGEDGWHVRFLGHVKCSPQRVVHTVAGPNPRSWLHRIGFDARDSGRQLSDAEKYWLHRSTRMLSIEYVDCL